tara:strand:- start:4105 stop:5091 length:987 start_codon:yes stop_codon:yes gene_type:complete
MRKLSYSEAILEAFTYLLDNHEEVFVIGQGLWSPWYVGNTMTNLDKKYGKDRIIDTPVSENAVTGAAIGASLCGFKPIVIHPRMDFMMYAMDPIINQAAKWSYMFGGQSNPQVTIRSIINRGGEQGAQHSQALHSMFAHVPGLRVVMPYSVSDARDLLIASVLCKDPVLYIDDRWLYDEKDLVGDIKIINLEEASSKIVKSGEDLTVVACSYSTKISLLAIQEFCKKKQITIELIDLRIINPIDTSIIINSVKKTNRLMVVDGGWKSCGLGSNIISSIFEEIDPSSIVSKPINISLKPSPAPCSRALEEDYYTSKNHIIDCLKQIFPE